MFRKETDNHKPDHRQTEGQGSESGNLGIPYHIAHDAAKQEWKISHYRVALLLFGSQADQQSCYKAIHLHLQHPGLTGGRRMGAFWTPRESNKYFVRWREGATAGVNPGGLAPLWGVDGGQRRCE